jgi:pimeloyl-ACP methyl ester carboxylesterase
MVRKSQVVSRVALVSGVLTFIAVFVLSHKAASDSGTESLPITEQLVYAKSADDVPNCGAMFASPRSTAKPVAIIWLHGWGQNFYFPTYVKIGRALAQRGYTSITINTRMHDVGFNIGNRDGKLMRGGGYWGVPSQEVRDVAGWIDFAAAQGFKNVVLVGHSAGWQTVGRYQAEKQDLRVIGLIFASGSFLPGGEKTDPEMLVQAKRLVAAGKGNDLLRFPDQHRSFPSFVSPDTFLDIANTPAEFTDFFGIKTANAAAKRVHCPILAWYGTNGDVGGAKDLEILKSWIQRPGNGFGRVDTVMIQNADHMYFGQEEQVADIIGKWADGLLAAKTVEPTPKQP